MKAATIFHLALGLLIISFFSLPNKFLAQDSGYLEPSEKYSREELAQMLAPIALYPDVLLSQVLMASTYPIEVIEADRWVRRNPELQVKALEAALLAEDWDPSVKALCHFPSILALMSERITETTNLGNAFLAQEAEVMDMVQELRAKADAQGNLTTTSEQKVIVEKETIIIEPADPRVIYVPYYDPFYIYDPWWYPAYPPFYWGPTGVSIGIGISYWPSFYFGFSFGSWSYFDWPNRYIYIDVHNRPRFVRDDKWISTPGRWHHAPRHRRGVAYRDKSTARKYGQDPGRNREIHGDRTRIDRDKRGDDLTNIDRNRDKQIRERVERDRQERAKNDLKRQQRKHVERDIQQGEQLELERKERERVKRDKQIYERIERNGQKRVKIDRNHKKRESVKRDKQQRERIDRKGENRIRAERDKQKVRKRVEREGQEREHVESDRQIRQQVDQETPEQERVERKQQQRSRDDIFNQIEDDRGRERESSEHERGNRQGLRDGSRGSDRSGDDDWGRSTR